MHKVPGPGSAWDYGHSTLNSLVVVDEAVCIGNKPCARYCPWETIDVVLCKEVRAAA